MIKIIVNHAYKTPEVEKLEAVILQALEGCGCVKVEDHPELKAAKHEDLARACENLGFCYECEGH